MPSTIMMVMGDTMGDITFNRVCVETKECEGRQHFQVGVLHWWCPGRQDLGGLGYLPFCFLRKGGQGGSGGGFYVFCEKAGMWM